MAQQSIPQMLLDGGIHENDKEIDQLPHLKMVIKHGRGHASVKPLGRPTNLGFGNPSGSL